VRLEERALVLLIETEDTSPKQEVQRDEARSLPDGTDLRQVTNTPDGEEFADWGTCSD
jgi:hypothetical protein